MEILSFVLFITSFFCFITGLAATIIVSTEIGNKIHLTWTIPLLLIGIGSGILFNEVNNYNNEEKIKKFSFETCAQEPTCFVRTVKETCYIQSNEKTKCFTHEETTKVIEK